MRIKVLNVYDGVSVFYHHRPIVQIELFDGHRFEYTYNILYIAKAEGVFKKFYVTRICS